MENAKKASILGKVLIFLAIVIVCISIGLSIFYFAEKSEVFKMQLEDGSSSYVNVGETLEVEVSRVDAKSTDYAVVSENEKIIKFVEKINSTTDSNVIIWKFIAVGGGNTAVRLDTENEDYKTLNIAIMVGDGSAEHPYYVRNATDLASLSSKTVNTTDSAQMKNFVQVFDIDLTYYLSKSRWTPTNFVGNYDGAGHIISGLKLVETGQNLGGLFRSIGLNSTVHNLVLSNFDIKGDYTYLGALAGVSNGDVYLVEVANTKLESVHTTTTNETPVKVGGLFGATGVTVNNSAVSEVTPSSVGSAANSWIIRVRGCTVGDETTLVAKTGAKIGGLVGKTLSTMVSNNYTFLRANAMSSSTVGGLVGEANSYTSGDTIFRNAVLNNYVVVDEITGTSPAVGAIVGQNFCGTEAKNLVFREETTYGQNRILGNYYYNRTTKNIGALSGFADNSNADRRMALSLSELQMQKRESFIGYDSRGSKVGWNFDTVWALDPNQNSGFPFIQKGAVLSRDNVFDVHVDDVTHVMYTISFETNGGTLVDDRTIEQGHSFNDENWSLPSTTRENYTFIGWYKDSGLTVEFDLNEGIMANTTLFAKWQENTPPPVVDTTWEVSFDTMGGSVINTISITKGNSFSGDGKILPTPTRDGFNFLGWYTSSAYLVEFNENTVINDDMTIYAQWEKKSDPVVVEKTAVEKLAAMFAADLADDGIYNNIYNIDWDIDGRTENGGYTTWTPIGTVSNPFRGEFNVKGTISNLKIVPNSGSSYVGFFGVIGQDGAVNGVTLKDIIVEVNNVKNPIIGILAGTNLGRIENAKIDVANNCGIKSTGCGYVIAGGLVGISNCVVDNCEVSAPIIVNAEKVCVGGIVGSLSDGKLSNSTYRAKSSKIALTTNPKAEDVGKTYDYAGGAVGCLVDGSIERCASTPAIIMNKNGDYTTYVGGIVGCMAETVVQRNNPNLYNCKAEDINIKGEVAGGLVGLMKINAISGVFDSVAQSYASGDVIGVEKAGGLIGSMIRGGMLNCYTTCNLSGGTVAGIAVDILRNGEKDYARAKNCFVNITVGEHNKAYVSTESKVFKVTNDTVPFGLFVKQEKLAGYVEHCVIVDNFGGEAQYGLQWFSPNTPIVGVIDWNHLDGNDDEKRVSADAAKKAGTFTSVGFDESVWEIVDGETPKLYQN